MQGEPQSRCIEIFLDMSGGISWNQYDPPPPKKKKKIWPRLWWSSTSPSAACINPQSNFGMSRFFFFRFSKRFRRWFFFLFLSFHISHFTVQLIETFSITLIEWEISGNDFPNCFFFTAFYPKIFSYLEFCLLQLFFFTYFIRYFESFSSSMNLRDLTVFSDNY